MSDRAALIQLLKTYFARDPADAARLVETLEPEKAAGIITALPASSASEIFSRLIPPFAQKVTGFIPKDHLGEILQNIDPQACSVLFHGLSADESLKLMESLPEKARDQIREMLTYPEDSVGRIMSQEYTSFRDDTTVRDTISRIRQMVKKKMPVYYLYVVDADRRLQGVVNMRDLILAQPDDTLGRIMMHDVFTVEPFAELESVAHKTAERKYLSAPVVDAERRLLGVVKTASLIEGAKEEASEDILRMFGAGGDEKTFSPVSFTIKKRLPWLLVNLATAFLAAFVVALFEDTIAKLTVLAVFLPVIAGQGGNAGGQTLAVVMRGLVMREIPATKAKALIIKETWIGVLNGLAIGLVTAVVAWAWHKSLVFGAVVGLGMLVNLMAAGFSGAVIPIFMKRIGLDPAQCSNIILTTVTDVVGFLAFLSIASLFIAWLV